MPGEDKTVLMPPPDAVAVGTQLSGTYELDQRIAAGGMGEVFKGHNIQTGDPVAIKIVLPEFARDTVILSLFRKEASILNHLSHEAIVRYHVFAIDQALGRPYLAMEFVDGMSLADMFARGPMPTEDARTLLHRVASGLAAAHEAGVIHRDLSPDNIILPGGKVGRAKIIDFGIARSANVGGETLLGGVFAGKYNFVSPEQLGMYGGEVTDRSDIYSLGLVMAAALRGAALTMSGSQVEVIEKRRVVPDLSTVDDSLRPIIEAMLQPDPEDRPQDMAEIADWVAPVRAARPSFDITHRAAMPSVDTTARQPSWTEQTAPQATQPPSTPAAQPTIVAPPPQPVSESPFGPYVGPANIPIPNAVSSPEPPSVDGKGRSKRGAIAAAVLTALAASVAGAVWWGLFAEPPLQTPDEPTNNAPPSSEQGTQQPTTEKQKSPPVAQTPESPGAKSPPPVPTDKAPVDADENNSVTEDVTLTVPAASGLLANATDAEGAAPKITAFTVAGQAGPFQLGTGYSISGVGTITVDADGSYSFAPAENYDGVIPAIGYTVSDGKLDDTSTLTLTMIPVEETPVEQPNISAQQIDWLKNYTGGDCFYAVPIAISETRSEIEGFGESVTAFDALLTAFQAKFGIEPEIQVRQLRPKQCPLTQLLGDLGRSTATPPDLSLAKYELADRDPMVGQVGIAPSRETYLLLVDHDGIVHNLESLLNRTGDVAKFDVPLGLGTSNTTARVPEVLLAISTSQPLQAVETATVPIPASDLFPRLLSEIKDKKMDAAATARYFRIRG